MSGYHENSIFWVETNKIQPNPFQPRREFEPGALDDLADSIRQYGVLQPLVVTRNEVLRPDGNGMDVLYELIAGERRLRASKIAGLQQVPVIIRKETNNKVKLELAIIENLQREDLNPIDRALAFEQLYKEFNLTHIEIGKRMGKSRVYVSNTLRLLSLPDEIKKGLMAGRISEGHTRPLLMLTDRPEEQTTLYKEIMVKKMSVRDAEKVARKIAQDKVRKKQFVVDPVIRKFEKQLAENLGTRVHIEPKEKGGQITIDYFTIKDLESILSSMKKVEREQSMMDSFLTGQHNNKAKETITAATGVSFTDPTSETSQPELVIPHNLPEVHHEELPAYKHIPNSDIVVSDKVLETVNIETSIESPKEKPTIEATSERLVNDQVTQESSLETSNNSLENMLDNLEDNLVSEKINSAPAVKNIIEPVAPVINSLRDEPIHSPKSTLENITPDVDNQFKSPVVESQDEFKNTTDRIEDKLEQNNTPQESQQVSDLKQEENIYQAQLHNSYQVPSEAIPAAPERQEYSAPSVPQMDSNQMYDPQKNTRGGVSEQYQAQNNGQQIPPQGQQRYVPQGQVHYQQVPVRKKSLFKRIFG